jgi:ABC-type anion transport system duplicated permease subunit
LSLTVSHSVEVLKPTSLGIGSNVAAETDDSSSEVVWLVIAIVAMVAFVCLFSYLIHKEGHVRARKLKMKEEKEMKGNEAKKQIAIK